MRPVLRPYKKLTEIEHCLACLYDRLEALEMDLASIERIENGDRRHVKTGDIYRAPEQSKIYIEAEFLFEIDASNVEKLEEQKQHLVDNLDIYQKLIAICEKINTGSYISRQEHTYLFENITNATLIPCFINYAKILPASPVSDLWSQKTDCDMEQVAATVKSVTP